MTKTTDNFKLHKTAPLPFIGQKRNFIKHYTAFIDCHVNYDGEGWTIIDAFGGSGLLAHVIKRIKPKATVIYNDFDGYSERLTHISETNTIRKKLYELLKHEPRSKKLNVQSKQCVVDCIAKFEGYVDMRTLAGWLLFSGKFANSLDELKKHTLYNRVRLSDYPTANDYLAGLKVVKSDFEALLTPHFNDNKCLFLLDPPYICTQQGMYNNDNYFGMVEFLRLMRLVRPPFIFFSSTRSELIDYLDFVVTNNAEGFDRLTGYQRVTINSCVNGMAKYEDNMVYKVDC